MADCCCWGEEVSAPTAKLELEVYNALVARGRTDNEANVIIKKLRSGNLFSGAAEIELSSDGRSVALSPCVAIAETAKALNVEFRGKATWIPHTQIDPMSEVTHKDDAGILVITKWIAEKKGFVDANGKPVSP